MKIIYSLILACLFVFLSLSGSTAASETASQAILVVPNYCASAPGGGSFAGSMSSAIRTYQLLIRDTLLTGLVGQEITAIAWRLLPSAGANWPATPVTFTNYDIYLSGSVAPENRSLTFANNVVGPQKRVRYGSLNVAAGSYPSGSSPNAFGPDITFDSAYLYTGGHLLVELRHTGAVGGNTSNDGILSTNGAYGYLVSGCYVANYTGTVASSQGNFTIMKLTSQTPVGIVQQTEIANNFSLSQNYPNPFNPSTTIKFSLPTAGKVTMKLFDFAGREVAVLFDNAEFSSGIKEYNFDGSKFASGVYFYSLFVDNNLIDTKKMILVK